MKKQTQAKLRMEYQLAYTPYGSNTRLRMEYQLAYTPYGSIWIKHKTSIIKMYIASLDFYNKLNFQGLTLTKLTFKSFKIFRK